MVLARIWNDGWFGRDLRTIDGRRVNIVYRGVWTHSNGPDFRDAMLEIDGRLLTGSVEVHVRSSQWNEHGHQSNPEYDGVVLHVVLEDDSATPCCGPSGVPIATLQIEPYLTGPVEEYVRQVVPFELGQIGSEACLPTLAGGRTDEVHAALGREGWRRMQDKQLRMQQELAVRLPGEVLYRSLLDSLGLTSNRSGMAAVADRLPLSIAERIAHDQDSLRLLAAMLGTGGLLPLSPSHLTLIADSTLDAEAFESTWNELSTRYMLTPADPRIWKLNRVRPLNHPVRRVSSMASLVAGSSDVGLLTTVLERLVDSDEGWDDWLAQAVPAIGESRRRQIIVNTLVPFVLAYSSILDDESLEERAAALLEGMSASVDDDVARKTLRQITGGKRFPVTSALEIQGLHQIGRNGCANLRCFECPIAGLALTFESVIPGAW